MHTSTHTYRVVHNSNFLLIVFFDFFDFFIIFRYLSDDSRLQNVMKPAVADKLPCYWIYIKSNIYLLFILYNSSITDIEHSPNYIAFDFPLFSHFGEWGGSFSYSVSFFWGGDFVVDDEIEKKRLKTREYLYKRGKI